MKNRKFLNETSMVFLMAMLVFMILSMTASVEANVEAKEAKSDVEEKAKRDAEKDAKKVNELKWFAGGFLGTFLPCISLCAFIQADANGVYLENELPRFLGFGTLYICCSSLIGVGALLPTGYAIFHSPTPRADRFLGKSSEYVEAYTTAYRKQAQLRRTALSATGCIAGISVGIFILHIFTPESYDTED